MVVFMVDITTPAGVIDTDQATHTKVAGLMTCPSCRGRRYILFQGVYTQHRCPTCRGEGEVALRAYVWQWISAAIVYLVCSLCPALIIWLLYAHNF